MPVQVKGNCFIVRDENKAAFAEAVVCCVTEAAVCCGHVLKQLYSAAVFCGFVPHIFKRARNCSCPVAVLCLVTFSCRLGDGLPRCIERMGASRGNRIAVFHFGPRAVLLPIPAAEGVTVFLRARGQAGVGFLACRVCDFVCMECAGCATHQVQGDNGFGPHRLRRRGFRSLYRLRL